MFSINQKFPFDIISSGVTMHILYYDRIIFMNFLEKIYTNDLVLQCIDTKIWNFSNYSEWMSSRTENRFIESINLDWGVTNLINYVDNINSSKNEMIIAISERQNLKHIGNMKFSNVDLVGKNAWVGVLIGDINYRGKGVFRQSFMAMAQFLFTNFGIKSICLGVNPRNVMAIRSYLRTGFIITKVSEFKYEMKFDINR